MANRVIKVFYGSDALPYQDQERTVHFPVLGNAFMGASNTTQIKFYCDKVGGGSKNAVVYGKLANGKKLFTLMGEYLDDSELSEGYYLFSLDALYTQCKGDLMLSLGAYSGGIIEEQPDTSYEVVGNTIVETTGVVKLNIAYSVQLDPNTTGVNGWDEILGALGQKADKNRVILTYGTYDALDSDYANYDEGQLFFVKEDNNIYVSYKDDQDVLRVKVQSYDDVGIFELTTLNNDDVLDDEQLKEAKKHFSIAIYNGDLYRKIKDTVDPITNNTIFTFAKDYSVVEDNSTGEINISNVSFDIEITVDEETSVETGTITNVSDNSYDTYSKNKEDELLADKLDDSQLKSTWSPTPSNDNIAGEKLVKDTLDTKLNNDQLVTSWGSTPTNENIPAEKLVKDSLDLKQDATDNSLDTTDKTIVGAINELKEGLDNAQENLAIYRGSFPTKSALNAYTGEKHNNDYAIVLDDETHNHECTRYIYVTGTTNAWVYQYTVNEAPMTQAQLDALNSGITSAKVNKLDGIPNPTSADYTKVIGVNEQGQYELMTGGGSGGLTVVTLSGTGGTLTTAQLTLLSNDGAVIKNSNRYFYKSDTGTNSITYKCPSITIDETNGTVISYFTISINTNNRHWDMVETTEQLDKAVELSGSSGTLTQEQYDLLVGDNAVIKSFYYSNEEYIVLTKDEVIYLDGQPRVIRYRRRDLDVSTSTISFTEETIQISSSTRNWTFTANNNDLKVNSNDSYVDNQDLENIVIGNIKYLNRTIIDVATLPTTNIKTDKLYRTPTILNGYKYNDEVVSSRTYYRIISTSQVTVSDTAITFITSQGTFTVALGSNVSTEITPQFTVANLIAQAVGQNLIATVGDELNSSFATATVPSGTYINIPSTITSYSEDSNIYYRDVVKNEWVSLLGGDGVKVITLVSDTGTLTADQLELAKTNNCVIVYMNEVYYKDSYFASNPPTVGHILYRTTHNETSALGTNNETIVRNRYIQINWDTGAYTNEVQEILEANATIPSGTTANDIVTLKVGNSYYQIPEGVKRVNLRTLAISGSNGTFTQDEYDILNSSTVEAVIVLTTTDSKTYIYRKDSVDANGVLRYNMVGNISNATGIYSYSIYIDTSRNWSTISYAWMSISWYGQGQYALVNTIDFRSSGGSHEVSHYSIDPIVHVNSLPTGNVNPSRLYGDTNRRLYYKRNNNDSTWKFLLNDSDIVTTFPVTPLDTNAPSTKLVKDNLDLKLAIKPDGTHDLIDTNDNKVNTFYLPDYLLGQVIYGGTVNGSTAVATLSASAKSKLGTTDNTITLTNDTTAITGYEANEGIYYVVSVAGTFAGLDLKIGDWLISNGSAWEKVDNTDEVTSVNNMTGAVMLYANNINMSNVDNRTVAESIAEAEVKVITLSGGSGTITQDQATILSSDNCIVNYEYTADNSEIFRKTETILSANKLYIFYESYKLRLGSSATEERRNAAVFNITDLTWFYLENIAGVTANPSSVATAELEKIMIGTTVYSIPEGMSVITLSGASGTITEQQTATLSGNNCLVRYAYSADEGYLLRKGTTMIVNNKLYISYDQDTINSDTNKLEGVHATISFNMTDRTWVYTESFGKVEANGQGNPSAELEKITVGSAVYSIPKGGIIDVTALPTGANINSEIIYRLTKDTWKYNGTEITVTNAYYIDDTDYYVTDSELLYLPVTEYTPQTIASLTNKSAVQAWLDANTSKWHRSSPNEISEWQSLVETADRFYGHNLTGSRTVNLFEHNGTSWNEVMSPVDFMLTDTPNTSEGSISIVLEGGSTPNPDIIQDGQNYRYSTTKTSSNNYINTALDEIKTMAEGSNKTYFIEYPNTLPSAGNRSLNSYYYVQIASGGTNYTRWFIDSTDVARNLGTTQIALADFILKTAIVTPDSSSTNEQVASAKGVYDNYGPLNAVYYGGTSSIDADNCVFNINRRNNLNRVFEKRVFYAAITDPIANISQWGELTTSINYYNQSDKQVVIDQVINVTNTADQTKKKVFTRRGLLDWTYSGDIWGNRAQITWKDWYPLEYPKISLSKAQDATNITSLDASFTVTGGVAQIQVRNIISSVDIGRVTAYNAISYPSLPRKEGLMFGVLYPFASETAPGGIQPKNAGLIEVFGLKANVRYLGNITLNLGY